MKNSSKSFTPLKVVVFSIAPLLILLILVELGLRIYYFNYHSLDPLAMVSLYKETRRVVISRMALNKFKLNAIPGGYGKYLFSPEGEKLLEDFKVRYEKEFKTLLEETRVIQSHFVVLYIPPSDYNNPSSESIQAQNFFKELTKKYCVDFIYVTDKFLPYSLNVVTLRPLNVHLSRFGNYLVARALSPYIDKYTDLRSNHTFTERPKVFGDLKPKSRRIWNVNPKMPYLVNVNNQGFRMDYNLSFPKTKQRILFLGDSFTFGPYLNNQDTYPGILNSQYPGREIINAGIAGYTIIDEASLFCERAKYLEPDITFLQVTDNDITGFFWFRRNNFDRKKRIHYPTKLEEEFIDIISR